MTNCRAAYLLLTLAVSPLSSCGEEPPKALPELDSNSSTPDLSTFIHLQPGTWCEVRGTRTSTSDGEPEVAEISQRVEVTANDGLNVKVSLVVSVNGEEEEWGKFSFPAAAKLRSPELVWRYALAPSPELEPRGTVSEEHSAGEHTFDCQRLDFHKETEFGTSDYSVWMSADAPGIGLVAVRTAWVPTGDAFSSPVTCELELWGAGLGETSSWTRAH